MRPWLAPASVSAVDDTSASPPLPDRVRSDPGDGLGLLPGGVLSGLQVAVGHLDSKDAFAAVAHEVEGLRANDLAGNCLPVSAALTRDDRSHGSSAGGRPVRSARPR